MCDSLWPHRPHRPGQGSLHCLPEFAQIHVHWIGDAIQPSHTLPPPSPVLNLSHHEDLFQWVSSLYQVAKLLELQRKGLFSNLIILFFIPTSLIAKTVLSLMNCFGNIDKNELNKSLHISVILILFHSCLSNTNTLSWLV